MFNKFYFSFVAFFAFGTAAVADDIKLPVMRFREAYESASDVVYAKIISVQETTKTVDVFKGAKQGEIKEAWLDISKQWKGKPGEKIKALFWGVPQGRTRDIESEKHKSNQLMPTDRDMLFFVHEESGKKLISGYWGIWSFRDPNVPEQFPSGVPTFFQSRFIQALEGLKKGKSMDAVVKEFALYKENAR